jgi:hypothetical protein
MKLSAIKTRIHSASTTSSIPQVPLCFNEVIQVPSRTVFHEDIDTQWRLFETKPFDDIAVAKILEMLIFSSGGAGYSGCLFWIAWVFWIVWVQIDGLSSINLVFLENM